MRVLCSMSDKDLLDTYYDVVKYQDDLDPRFILLVISELFQRRLLEVEYGEEQ